MTIWNKEQRVEVAKKMYEEYYHGKRTVKCRACGGDREVAWSMQSLGDKYYCSSATARNLIEEHTERLKNDPNRQANKSDVASAVWNFTQPLRVSNK